MTEGGGIAKKMVTTADDSVDAETVARWLNCSSRMVRQYAEEGLVVRVGPGRFDLERSVGNVILHLRELASSRRGADGVDAVKASAALKDAQRKLAELKVPATRRATDLAARGGGGVVGARALGPHAVPIAPGRGLALFFRT